MQVCEEDGDQAQIELKTCPNCGRKVLSLITDNAKAKRYCYHCIPNPENCPGPVFVAKKMDELNAAGKLDTYPLEQRIRDLNDPPRCNVCGAVVDGEICNKCDGGAIVLAHQQRRELGLIKGGRAMLLETNFGERFIKCIPQLMNCAAFAKKLRDSVGGSLSDWGDERKRSDLLQNAADEDTLFDDAFNAYNECAETVLTLGWTGGSAGNSGAIWLHNCEGIYVITSSDYDDMGPFPSLEDALKEECFHGAPPQPELDSAVLPEERLLTIARGVADWVNGGSIRINSELYQVAGDELIPNAEK